MSWTTEHDLILCKEILFVNPYAAKKKSVQRSGLWQLIADNLNSIENPRFIMDKRAVRDHIQVLIDRFKREEATEARESGITPEHSKLDNTIEQIIAMECTESNDEDGSAQKKEQDRAKAEAMRQKAMETLGKRKPDETTAGSSKKRRRGSDTLVYLLEKAVQEQALRQEELQLKQAQHDLESKRTEAFITQQARMEAQQGEMLQMMRQQQAEQNRFIMALMANLSINNFYWFVLCNSLLEGSVI